MGEIQRHGWSQLTGIGNDNQCLVGVSLLSECSTFNDRQKYEEERMNNDESGERNLTELV